MKTTVKTKSTYVEIELNGTVTAKRLDMPVEKLSNSVEASEYIRKHYKTLGYQVGKYLKIY